MHGVSCIDQAVGVGEGSWLGDHISLHDRLKFPGSAHRGVHNHTLPQAQIRHSADVSDESAVAKPVSIQSTRTLNIRSACVHPDR